MSRKSGLNDDPFNMMGTTAEKPNDLPIIENETSKEKNNTKETKNESVKVEKVIDTKLQEENERLKKQSYEKDQKIKELEARKPAGRPKIYDKDQFIKYSLNIRKDFLLFMQNYAHIKMGGQVATVFDTAIKDFIKKVSKENIEEVKRSLRSQGRNFENLFNAIEKE